MKRNDNLVCHLCAFTTVLLWAGTNVANRILRGAFTANQISAVRFLIAAVIMLAIALVKKVKLPRKQDLPLLALSALTGLVLRNIALAVSAKNLPVAIGSIIQATSPVFTVLLAWIILHEPLNKLGWIAVAIEFAGITILSIGETTVGEGLWIGVAAALTAAIVMAVYNLLQRRIVKLYSPLESNIYGSVLAAFMLAYFLPSSFASIPAATSFQIGALIFQGVGPAAISYLLWNQAMKLAKKTSDVSNYMFLTPVLTTILGMFILKEIPSVNTLIGGGIIMAGLVLYRVSARKG